MQRAALDPAASRAVLDGLAGPLRRPMTTRQGGSQASLPSALMADQLIPPGAPEFRARFAAFSYSVFRLETLQSYGNSGEEVRIVRVAENESWPSDVPRSDYFLFGSSELYLQHYDDAGEWLGTEPITDPVAIVRACRWRDAALCRATPWWDYLRNHHPELVQRAVARSQASGRR